MNKRQRKKTSPPVVEDVILTVRMSDWEKIREGFSLEERENLRTATCGQIICPRSAVLKRDLVPSALLKKLESSLSLLKAARP